MDGMVTTLMTEIAELTDWDELHRMARKRGIRDPRSHRVMCSQCGVELGPMGIVHWPDCDAMPSGIVFLPRDP